MLHEEIGEALNPISWFHSVQFLVKKILIILKNYNLFYVLHPLVVLNVTFRKKYIQIKKVLNYMKLKKQGPN